MDTVHNITIRNNQGKFVKLQLIDGTTLKYAENEEDAAQKALPKHLVKPKKPK